MRVGLLRNDDEILKYKSTLKNSASPKTNHLFEVVHDAIDRMVMQSDLRDVYHNVRIVGFSSVNRSMIKTNDERIDHGAGIDTEFYLQLSDNNHDESHLVDVFQRYLRGHNYSLGGTHIYSSKQFMDAMSASGLYSLIFTLS